MYFNLDDDLHPGTEAGRRSPRSRSPLDGCPMSCMCVYRVLYMRLSYPPVHDIPVVLLYLFSQKLVAGHVLACALPSATPPYMYGMPLHDLSTWLTRCTVLQRALVEK